MTVTIPATVTNLASAFYGCTNLTEVTLEHTHSALVDGTVTMTNAFQGCTSLATVHCHNAPTINEDGNWHAYRITSNGSVNVYNGEELNDWNDSETPVSLSGNIVATKKTNLVSFGDFTDAQVKDVMDYGKSFTSKSALVPNAKNFVLWGAPNTNFQTNLPLGGGGSAGDGISISGGYISQTTDQLTFTGTQAQWSALSSADKAKYGLVNITDDEYADLAKYRYYGNRTNIYSSSSYDQTVAHSLTKNLTLDKGLYFLRAMARNVSAGVASNNVTISINGFTFINCWDTSSAGWSNAIDAVVLPIGSSQSCVVTVSQPAGMQYEVSITKLS